MGFRSHAFRKERMLNGVVLYSSSIKHTFDAKTKGPSEPKKRLGGPCRISTTRVRDSHSP